MSTVFLHQKNQNILSRGLHFVFAVVLLCVLASFDAVEACDFYAGSYGPKYECKDRMCDTACQSFNDVKVTTDKEQLWMSMTPEPWHATNNDVDPTSPKLDLWNEVGGTGKDKKWKEWFEDTGKWRDRAQKEKSPMPTLMLSYNQTRLSFFRTNSWCFHVAAKFKHYSFGSNTDDTLLDMVRGDADILNPFTTRYNYNSVTCSAEVFSCPVETCSAYGVADHSTASGCTAGSAGSKSVCQIDDWNGPEYRRSVERWSTILNWTRRDSVFEDLVVPSRMSRQQAYDWCDQFTDATWGTTGGLAAYTNTNGAWIEERTRDSDSKVMYQYWADSDEAEGWQSFVGMRKPDCAGVTFADPWNSGSMNVAPYQQTQHPDLVVNSACYRCNNDATGRSMSETGNDPMCVTREWHGIAIESSHEQRYRYFLCTRTLVEWQTIRYRMNEGGGNNLNWNQPCFRFRQCQWNIILPTQLTRLISSKLEMRATLSGQTVHNNLGWGAYRSSQDRNWMVGRKGWAFFFRLGEPGTVSVDLSYIGADGRDFGVNTISSTIEFRPLFNMTVKTWTHWDDTNTQAVWFTGETVSFTAVQQEKQYPFGVTTPLPNSHAGCSPPQLPAGGACVEFVASSSFTTNNAGGHANNAPSEYAVSWTVAAQTPAIRYLRFIHATTLTNHDWGSYWWRIDVRNPGAFTRSLSATSITAGASSTITVGSTNANPVHYATTVTPSSSCGGLNFSPTSVTFNVNDNNPSRTITVTSGAGMASSTCTITFAHTSSGQWQTAPASIDLTVLSQNSLSIPTWTSAMSCGDSYTFVVEAAQVLSSGTAVVTPTCTTSSGIGTPAITPASLTLSTTVRSLSFSISATCTAAYSCNLALAVTGTATAQIQTPYPTESGSWTDLKVVGTTLVSPSFVGRTITIKFDDSSALLATQEIDISWSVTPTTLTNVTSGTIKLTFLAPEFTLYLEATAAGTATFAFTIDSAPSQYDTTMPNKVLTINPLKTFSSTPAAIAANLSIGYTTTLSVAISGTPFAYGATVTNVVFTPVFDSTYISVSPASKTWASDDVTNDPQVFTFTGIAAQDPVPVSFSLSGTAPDYDMSSTLDVSSTRVYQRALVNVSHTAITLFDVTGSTVTVTFTLSKALPFDFEVTASVPIPTTIPSTAITFAASTTSTTVVFSKSSVGTGTATFVRSTNNEGWQNEEVEAYIVPIEVETRSPRTMDFTCNATELYFGPGWVLNCTASITEFPTTGAMGTTISGVTAGIFEFSTAADGTGKAASLTEAFSATTKSITFYAWPVMSPLAITDLTSYDIQATVNDASFSFDTTTKTQSVVARELYLVTLAHITTGRVYVGMTFTIEITSTQVPDMFLTTTPGPAGITWSNSTISLYNQSSATPMKAYINGTTNTADSYTLQFGVAGSDIFASLSSTITRDILPRQSITQAPAGLITMFLNQTTPIDLTVLGNFPTVGTDYRLTPRFYCNGVYTPTAMNFSSDIYWNETSTSDDTRIYMTAVEPCLSGGEIFWEQSGSSIIYNPLANTTIELRPRKRVTVTPSNFILYGGEINTTTIFLLTDALPFISGGAVDVTITNNDTGTLKIPYTAPVSPIVFTFDSGSYVNPDFEARAVTVTETKFVELAITMTGNAVTEYELIDTSIIIEVRPVVVVNISDTLTNHQIIFVGGQFARLVQVTLPVLPESGNVVITPIFNNGAPSAVSFSPNPLTLNRANPTAFINVTAKAATSGSEAISFTYSGTASEYFPQLASAQYPVTFQARGVFTIGNIPASVFRGALNSEDISITISYAPPAGYGDVTLSVVPATASISASPTSVTWSAGDTVLEQAITLTGDVIEANVFVDFVVTGPAIYLPDPSPTSAIITVLNEKAVIFTMPTFVYVNGLAVSGSVSVVNNPPTGTLDVIPSIAGSVQPLSFVPSTTTFTPSTSLTQPISITAIIPSPVDFSNPPLTSTFTVSINLLGTFQTGAAAADKYQAPADFTVEIRALETLIATGLPAETYVGLKNTITVTLSRLPIKASTYIEVKPVFGSADASFAPAYQQWLSDGSTPLAQTFEFTAITATTGTVGVSLDIDGTQTEIFESSVQSAVAAVRIYDKERVNVYTAPNLTDGAGGFTYQFNSLPLNVSLGAPKIAHSGVNLTLGYTGRALSATFDPPVVEFAPGENWKIVQMYSVLNSGPGQITVTVDKGSDIFLPAVSLPTVRLLDRIPVTLNYNPANTLIVVNRTTTLSVTIDSAALAGDLQVSLTYGPEITFGAAVDFLALTPQLNKNIDCFGNVYSPEKNLTIVLSGTASTFYLPVQWNFPTVVRQPKEVRFTFLPKEVYMGTMNREVIVFNLSTMPTLSSDSIRVTFTETANFKFNRSGSDPPGVTVITLSAANPVGAVKIEGINPSNVILRNFVSITSISQEYLGNIGLTAPMTSSAVPIRVRQAVTSSNYISNFFVGSTRFFNFTLSQIPAKGVLTLTPRLTGPGSTYEVYFTPATLVFSNAPGSSIEATLNVTVSSTALAGATFELVATGSTDFLDIPFSAPFDVIDLPQVAVSGVPLFMYPGAINTVPVTISISAPPAGNLTVVLAPTPGSFLAFTPNFVFFNGSTPIDLILYLRATNYQPEKANMSMTNTEYPTSFYQVPPLLPQVQIRAPDTVTAVLSTLIVYHGTDITISITLSTAPSSDLTLDLVMKKNQTGTGNTMVELSAAEVNIPTTQLNMFGQTSASFTATALSSPLDVEVSFIIGGLAAKTFQPQELLPKFLIQFAPLRTIVVNVPPTMYLGLEANVTITLENPVDAGSSVQVNVIPDAILGLGSAPSNNWGSPLDPVQYYFTCQPTSTGAANLQFLVGLTGTVAYETITRPSNIITLTIKDPTVIGLGARPANVFWGSVNAINIATTITGDALTTDDEVIVRLTTNDTSCIVMNPTNGILTMPTTSGVFGLHATRPCVAYFNLSFTSKLNRFVLAPSAEFVTINFRELKPIQVIPPLTEYIVGQPVPYTVVLDEKPEPGRTLIAQFSYSGSPGNVNLPASVGWTSGTTSLSRTLTASGASTTDVQTLSVVFSGDTQYNLTKFDWPMKFNPLLNVIHDMPTSAFYKRNITGHSFSVEAAMNVTLTFSTSPIDSFVFYPSKLEWLPTDTVLTRSIMFRAEKIPSSPVVLSFTVSGPDASKFNSIPNFAISVVPADAILIIAPSSSMTVYLKPGFTIQLGVMISEPAHGVMTVTPTWAGCPPDFANFTVSPLTFTPTSNVIQYTEVFGLYPRANCALQFPLGGVTGPFTGTGNLYSVTVRNLFLISLIQNTKRVFLGAANKIPISVKMDNDLALPSNPAIVRPPDEQIVVNFWTTEPCLSINPMSLIWAKGATTESISKEIFVTATSVTACSDNTNRVIHVNLTTISGIYNNTVPTKIYVDVLPLLKVSTSETNGGSGAFYMWVGDSPLTFDVLIPEPLTPTEGMEVIPEYSGISGSVNILTALWSPSPIPKVTQPAIVSSVTISPEAALVFRVDGPPRFEPYATGGGTLEIFGPLSVVANVPKILISNVNYTIDVDLQDKPFPGVKLIVTPVWIGSPNSMKFYPPSLTFEFTTDKKQSLILAALDPSGAYRLQFVVSGSRRFVESAFDGLVAVQQPTVIVHRSLPQQLMMGKTYNLVIDVQQLPLEFDTLNVQIIPEKNLLDCIEVTPALMTFVSGGTVPTTLKYASVKPVRVCDAKFFDINFLVYGNASYMYQKNVIPRKYQTIAASSLSVSWTTEAYVGAANAPELLLTVNDMPSYPDNVTIKIEQIGTVNITNISFTEEAVWLDTDNKEKQLTLFGLEPGNATLRFSVVHAPSGFSYTPTEYTIEFFPLLSVKRDSIPASFYQDDKNKLLVNIDLSASLRHLENRPPMTLKLQPQAKNSRVIFQPAELSWSPGQAASQLMYITGLVAGQDNITFTFYGDGAPLLTNGLPHQEIDVLPLRLIEFTQQPPILYVGPANSRTVTLEAPPIAVFMSVTATVEGEPNALQITPSLIAWNWNSPRLQQVTLTGAYGSPVQCLLRYRLQAGPSNVDVRDSLGSQTTVVTALRQLKKFPDRKVFTYPELSDFKLTFSPNMPVDCHFVPNITSAVTDATTNVTTVKLLTSGFSEANCVPRDTTYAAVDPFTIDATPLKRFTISPKIINTFVGTSVPVDFAVTESPEGGTMTVKPDLDVIDNISGDQMNYFVAADPFIVLYTETSALSTRIIFTGQNLTDGLKNITLKFSGPTSEYLMNDEAVSLMINVRAPIRISATPSDLLNQTMVNGVFVTYVGGDNGGVWDFDITGVPLNGPIKVSLYSTNNTIIFSPSIIYFQTGVDILQIKTKVWSHVPISEATITASVEGPSELIRPKIPGSDASGDGKILLGRITVRPLYTIRGANDKGVDTLPSIMYVGIANKKPLTISVNGFPLPEQYVAVRITAKSCGLSASPLRLKWESNYFADEPETVFSKISDITGTAPGACTLELTSIAIPGQAGRLPATNFLHNVSLGTKVISVRPIITFDITFPTASSELPGAPLDGKVLTKAELIADKQDFDMFNGQVNGRPIIVTLSDIPVDKTRTAKINAEVVCNPAPCDKDIFVLSWTTLDTGDPNQLAPGSKSAQLFVYAKPGTAGNATVNLTISASSTSEFDVGQSKSIFVIAKPLLKFDIIDLRPKFAFGLANRVFFKIRPEIAASLTANVAMTCPAQVIVTAPEPLVWQNDKKELVIQMYAPAQTDEGRCSVTVRIGGGTSKSTFEEVVVNEPVQAFVKPEIIPWTTTVPYTSLQKRSRFTIELRPNPDLFSFKAAVDQTTDVENPDNSSISIKSDVAAVEDSVILRYIKNPERYSVTRISPTQLELIFDFGIDFKLLNGEELTIKINPRALMNNEQFKAKEDTVYLNIDGQTEIRQAAGLQTANGVAGTAIASAAMNLHTALLVGRVLGLQDLAKCPDKNWKEQQSDMGWFRQPFHMRFGDNDSLGTYAAVGVTTLLIMAAIIGLHLLVTYGVHRYRNNTTAWDKSFGASLAMCRFPSLDFFPIMFFYQVVVATGLAVIMYSPNVALRFIGAFSFLIVGFGLPILILLRVKPGFHARWYKTESQFMDDIRRIEAEDEAKKGGTTLAAASKPMLPDGGDIDNKSDSKTSSSDAIAAAPNTADAAAAAENNQFANKLDAQVEASGGATGLMAYIVATGFWRNPVDVYWVPRYGMLFDRYSENFKTWLVWETIFSFIVGVLDGISPDNIGFCKAKTIVLILMYAANMLIMWVCRPFRRAWWNGLFGFAYFLMFMAACLIGDGVMKEDPEADTIESGMTTLFFHTLILILMAVLDLIMGIAGVFGIQNIMKLRITGRIDQAKDHNVNDDTQEMKAQMARDDFNRMMDTHAEHQAIEHQVAEKKAEADRKMKAGVRNVVNAETEFSPFAVDGTTSTKSRVNVDFTQEEMDLI